MSLILPGSTRPTNLHLRPDQLRYNLDGETLHWLENLPREVEQGDRLFVLLQEDHPKPFIIMEHADDGTDMFVYRTAQLSSQTYERLRYMRRVPLSKRLAEAEKQEEKNAAEAREQEMADLWERIGGPMYHQLHHDGFAHGAKSVNVPLKNKAARRHRAFKGIA